MLLPGQMMDAVANGAMSGDAGCFGGGAGQPERLTFGCDREGTLLQNGGSLRRLSLDTILTDADVRRLLCILSAR